MRLTPIAAALAAAVVVGCHDATPSAPTAPDLARGGAASGAAGNALAEAGRVAICHAAGRLEDQRFHEISVAAGAVATHVAEHGDYLVTSRTPCPPPPVVNNVRVCKAVSPGMPVGRTFAFDVNGQAIVLTGGTCAERTFRVGTDVTVRETVPTGTVLDAITVAPSIAGGGDVATATATIVAGSDVATVTFTNRALLGELQLCKRVTGGILPGTAFWFDLSAPPYPPRNADVPSAAGASPFQSCVAAGTYAVGTEVSIFEESLNFRASFGIRVTDIAVDPADRLVAGSVSLAGGRVRVVVGAGVTRVAFTDERTLVPLSICKRSPASATGTVTVGIPDAPWADGSAGFEVPANGCVAVNAFPPLTGVPAGTTLLLRERIPSGQRLAGVTTDPADALLAADLATGFVTVRVGSVATTVTFDDVHAFPP